MVNLKVTTLGMDHCMLVQEAGSFFSKTILEKKDKNVRCEFIMWPLHGMLHIKLSLHGHYFYDNVHILNAQNGLIIIHLRGWHICMEQSLEDKMGIGTTNVFKIENYTARPFHS